MRGFTSVTSNIIFFVGVILATALAVTALSLSVKGIQHAMGERANIEAQRTYTLITIVEGSGDASSGNLWVYVENIGRTSLDVNGFDIFVNSVLVGPCNEGNVVCTDESGDYVLDPGELMEVNIAGVVTSSGTYTVKVLTENSVSDSYEVVVG